MRSSILPLLIVLAPQIALAAVQSGVPVLAPAIVASLGMEPEAVGLLGGVMGFGSVWFFAANRAVTPVLGPLRALMAAAALAIAGTGLLLTGFLPAVFAGAVAIGFAYAVTAPAGSQILSRHTPRRLWGTLFSIRQSGVPMGATIAGLVGAGLAAAFGWRWGAAALAVVPLACIAVLALAPERFREGASGAPFRPRALFAPANAAAPFVTLGRMPQLRLLTLASLGFAMGQGSGFAFLTTFLTDSLGFSLALAGAVFSMAQLASFAGRVAVGVLADRLGSTRWMLVAMAVASAASLVLISAFGADWPRWLIFACAAAAGASIATWNGLFLAEIAKVAPEDEVAEATASATFFTFVAYMFAPPLFGAMVWLAGYGAAYYLVAALVLSAGAVLALSRGGTVAER